MKYMRIQSEVKVLDGVNTNCAVENLELSVAKLHLPAPSSPTLFNPHRRW